MENTNNPLSNKLTLLMILASVIFCFQVFSFFRSGNETQKVNYIKKEINGLKDDVSKIYEKENSMGQKIDTFNSRIKGIHEAVNINNDKIENLKKDEKNKLNSFKSYTACQYQEYFPKRYGKKPIPCTYTGK